MGAVIVNQTGDQTMLNQAVQEASNNSSYSNVYRKSNQLNNNFSQVLPALNSACILIEDRDSETFKYINNCGQKIYLQHEINSTGTYPHNVIPSNCFEPNSKIGCVDILNNGDELIWNSHYPKGIYVVCPDAHFPVIPNFAEIINSKGSDNKRDYGWKGEGPVVCWDSTNY